MTRKTSIKNKLDKIGGRIEAARAAIYSHGDHNMTLAQCKLVAPVEMVQAFEDACYDYDRAVGRAA